MPKQVETNIVKAIMLACQPHGVTLMRNVRGMFYPKTPVDRIVAAVKSGNLNAARAACADLYPIKAGLDIDGSSDLIGWNESGHMVAIEVKTATGRIDDKQTKFVSLVSATGGKAGIARNIEDALKIIA